MLKKYLPNIYLKSILDLDIQKLQNKNIKCLLIDIDNTISPVNSKEIEPKIKNKIIELKKHFQVIIVSNATKGRTNIFKKNLGIDGYYLSWKPHKRVYKKIIIQNNLLPKEILAIGDQILTDIIGANKLGINSLLVTPLTNHDLPLTKINRLKEKFIFKKLNKNNLLTKGVYYD